MTLLTYIYMYIHIYIYIIFKMLKLKCYNVCHNTLGSLNPAPRHETVPVSGQDAAAVAEWPTSRILESKMLFPFELSLRFAARAGVLDQLLVYKCTPPCGRLSTKVILQLRYKEINVRLIPTMLFGLRFPNSLCFTSGRTVSLSVCVPHHWCSPVARKVE